jgi:hypothetical protein
MRAGCFGIGGDKADPPPTPSRRAREGAEKTNADLTQGGSHFAPLPWASELLPLRGAGREEKELKVIKQIWIRVGA